MNNFDPEDLLSIAKQKTHEEVTNSLDWKLSHGFSTRRFLLALGGWMVVNGKRIQARHAASLLSTQVSFLQNKTRKHGA